MQPIDFSCLTRFIPQSPNFAVALPSPCPLLAFQPDFIKTPPFSHSAHQLIKIIESLLVEQPRTSITFSDRPNHQLQLRQQTKWLKFPDWIDIKVFERDTQSFLLMVSRSQYGYYDFGTNKKRLVRWLFCIEASIEKGSYNMG